jgi:hypothetical protein
VSSTSPREYEFNEGQNQLIGGLAARMRVVGLFLVVVAIINFLIALLVILVIYRTKLPQSYVDAVLTKVSEGTKVDMKKQLTENLPADNHLWGIAFGNAINGLLYLLIGVWTRNAAGSFRLIVETKGTDISLLMSALSALNKMYTLVYTLIMVGLLVLLVSFGLFLFSHLAR